MQGNNTLFYRSFAEKFEQQLNLEISRRQNPKVFIVSDIRVQELAKRLNMDVSNLRRQCQKHYQKSPKALIDIYRIRKARKLLSKGIRPSVIAAQLGFYEHKTFSTVFKRHVGIAPSEFIKSHCAFDI
ncbi:MAG TPA: AraC family transcriptional regulator [Alteromonas australica]|jgi:AraC-like DNA-binding protein|uniref:AraC family transcriptional regulator n=1 Tax=Alteromonas australica TaxID=589873 RepID=A0A075NY47_9ALTE|nr:helix-turn-helix transcriptional regulator [Alteromonas australica]MAB93616.1 AraC family transcriptional regulator [Alteromonas sp.]QPL51116.1 helix-turn-helix transcriptional regulator [Alteromonas sp. B31-7]AIF99614.1 hypothetical protein EP13_13460 [Alteromonas australica]AJP44614.1 hypothetical protein EP12_14100 [Alteromonas australica]MAF70275.1 AraC family transcriptional regulator [Alteromonas sp.]|tara:strand:+ start:862 stop:1245 length:384 start_codon:yes stop_codon:yes gene_type:complete